MGSYWGLFTKLFISIHVLLFSLCVFATDKSQQEYWADSGLTLSFAFETINNKTCYSNKIEYSGCLFALERLMSQTPGAPLLKPADQTTADDIKVLEAHFGVSLQKENDNYFVVDVDAQGPAKRAGFRLGDVVVDLDQELLVSDPFAGKDSVFQIMSQKTKLKIDVIRDKTKKSFDLERRPIIFGTFALIQKKDEEDKSQLTVYDIWQETLTQRNETQKNHFEAFEKSKQALTLGKKLGQIIGVVHFSYAMKRVAELLPKDSKIRWPYFASQVINEYIVKAKDAHGRIAPSEMILEERQRPDKKIAGIGVQIHQIGNRTIVLRVMIGLGAQAAGVQANDEIFSVNGKEVRGLAVNDIVKLIIGEVGTKVNITFRRGVASYTVPILRKTIHVKNVATEYSNYNGLKIGLIRIAGFSRTDTCDKTAEAVEEVMLEKVDGVVVDFRNNGGGLLDEAICMIGLFVGTNKTAVSVKNLQPIPGRKNENIFLTYNSSVLSDDLTIPVEVLINEGSASASEILSGALQDHKRSWIIGERSFGKGTVQRGSLFGQGDGLNLTKYETIQKFFLPSGRSNQLVGVMPDFNVSMRPGMTQKQRFALREAELYPNAVSGEEVPWRQPRVEQANLIQDCVSSQGNLHGRWQASAASKNGKYMDYQLLYAADVIRCELASLSNEKL